MKYSSVVICSLGLIEGVTSNGVQMSELQG